MAILTKTQKEIWEISWMNRQAESTICRRKISTLSGMLSGNSYTLDGAITRKHILTDQGSIARALKDDSRFMFTFPKDQ